MDELTIKSFDPENLNNLENQWRYLENGSDMTVFQSYDWYKDINALYFKEKIKNKFRHWEYLLVEKNKQPVMIAPVQIILFGLHYKYLGLKRGYYFIGRQGYTDYLNYIYLDFSAEAFDLIEEYLNSKYHINFHCFEQLLDSTQMARYIINNFTHKKSEVYCAALTLPETFQDYIKMLSKSTKQNIRTALNRQRRDGKNLEHTLVYNISEKEANELMAIREKRLKDKKKRSREKATIAGRIYGSLRGLVKSIFDAKHDIIKGECSSWCFLVKDGARIVSFFWGIYEKSKKRYYVILAGVDPEYTWYSPSISHLYMFIEEMYNNDNVIFDVLDFTRGGERYKEDLGAKKNLAWTIRFSSI